MTTFDDREKHFESKYRHDEELKFKVNARRNRLLGEWVGDLLGLEGETLTVYAKEVVTADFEKPGDDDVVEKVLADLTGKGIEISDHRIRKQMEELLAIAKEQVMNE